MATITKQQQIMMRQPANGTTVRVEDEVAGKLIVFGISLLISSEQKK